MATTSTTSPITPTVTTLTATAIVVADMVGVGVFTSLGFQVKDITSGFTLLLLWFVGGVVAMCGAICYAELAAMFPRSSGEYNFLRQSFHPAVGFLAGWISATVGFAAPVAVAAMAFGKYSEGIVPGAPPLLLALGMLWLVSIVQLLGLKHSSLFQTVSTVIKVVLIVAFILIGFSIGGDSQVSFAPSSIDLGQIFSAPFAISLFYVMYSYSGWNAATYITGEIRDPERSLPRALFAGTFIVLVLYVALNAVFLYTTPIDKMVMKVEVAMVVGDQLFGSLGGQIVAGLICIGLISAISAMMWIGPRVTMAIGEDFSVFRVFSRKSSTGAPTAAILLQTVIASLLLCTQTFETVIKFIQFSLIFCSFLTVVGLIKLRVTSPDIHRPYRAWGYPVTPLIFMAVTMFMMYHLIVTETQQSLASFSLMLVGLVIYAIIQVRAPRGPVQQVIVSK